MKYWVFQLDVYKDKGIDMLGSGTACMCFAKAYAKDIKEILGKEKNAIFIYSDDKITVQIDVATVDKKTKDILERTSRGFFGLEWMAENIIKYKNIKNDKG
jgi:hypothetical protein